MYVCTRLLMYIRSMYLYLLYTLFIPFAVSSFILCLLYLLYLLSLLIFTMLIYSFMHWFTYLFSLYGYLGTYLCIYALGLLTCAYSVDVTHWCEARRRGRQDSQDLLHIYNYSMSERGEACKGKSRLISLFTHQYPLALKARRGREQCYQIHTHYIVFSGSWRISNQAKHQDFTILTQTSLGHRYGRSYWCFWTWNR